MIIDIVFLLFVIMAIFKGLSKGLVLGIFSLLAFMIGLAAALKLSAVVAVYLHKDPGTMNKWLPVLAFLLVFVLFIVLVSVLGRLIRKALQIAMLGWLDSLGGMIFYIVLYVIIFSVLLFYAEKLLLLSAEDIANSKAYPYVVSWGPKLINNFGKVIPAFKDMFGQLERFFATMAAKGA